MVWQAIFDQVDEVNDISHSRAKRQDDVVPNERRRWMIDLRDLPIGKPEFGERLFVELVPSNGFRVLDLLGFCSSRLF